MNGWSRAICILNIFKRKTTPAFFSDYFQTCFRLRKNSNKFEQFSQKSNEQKMFKKILLETFFQIKHNKMNRFQKKTGVVFRSKVLTLMHLRQYLVIQRVYQNPLSELGAIVNNPWDPMSTSRIQILWTNERTEC